MLDRMTDQPPPLPVVASPSPVPAARRTGIWQLVVGIILALFGLPNVIRGISGIIATTTQPGMVSPAVPAGFLFFGAVLVLLAVLLIRAFVKIRAANSAADAGAAVGPVPPPPAA